MAAIGAAFLPILVLLLVLLALAEGLLVWFSGRGFVPWLRKRTGRPLSRAVYADFGRLYQGGKQIEIDQAQADRMLRHEDQAGAPPPVDVDLDAGVIYLNQRRSDERDTS
jgi:hypothetical protein